MSLRVHLTVFLAAITVWAGFLLAGLPSYYQQYSQTFMIWFDSLVFVPIARLSGSYSSVFVLRDG